jgi:uncharacterized membrane protein YwzB
MKKQYYKITAWICAFSLFLLPIASHAQISGAVQELKDIQTEAGVSSTSANLPALVGSLINVLLSVLGIVFVILMVYAGFLYMTASGEEDKVKKAKKLISQAVIGLIIIVAAYAISNFVFQQLAAATTVKVPVNEGG